MRAFFLGLALSVSACAGVPGEIVTRPDPEPTQNFGVLVMAHGGSSEWNALVDQAVQPLADRVPSAVAYGMADPHTLRLALDSLRSANVDRVAVVRLFMSGQSFLDQTLYLLGLSEKPPARYIVDEEEHAKTIAPIPHGFRIATHENGLMGSDHAALIMVERALAESVEQRGESVLLIAHGMENDNENQSVLTAMEQIARRLRLEGFTSVEIATLREDWEDLRASAELEIRSFVEDQTARERRVIVLPFRLSGFGPYASVLSGLEYAAAEGLLPHAQVTDWITETAGLIACARGWANALDDCATMTGEGPQ